MYAKYVFKSKCSNQPLVSKTLEEEGVEPIEEQQSRHQTPSSKAKKDSSTKAQTPHPSKKKRKMENFEERFLVK